jgi:hypothetical protein
MERWCLFLFVQDGYHVLPLGGRCGSGASYSQREGHGCHVITRQSSTGSTVRPGGNVQWIFVLTASCYRNRLVFAVKRLMLQKDLVLGS